ncbi:MAG: hypothetical protein AB1757_03520 [Acidobacteriota bacterium]
MEAIKHKVRIPADKQIKIRLPDYVLVDEEAEVIVLFKSASSNQSKKVSQMQEAVNDPLFLADLNTVMEDFKYADNLGEDL